MAFFLGKRVSPETGETTDEPVTYKPKHLTTHGLCFGMTGSGKTGMCIGILEEAGRADIPVIAIDPKGDLTNLALCWPGLEPDKFATWVDPSDLDAGVTAAELGAKRAEIWRNGLAGNPITPEQIAEYRERTGVTIYTPGSTTGVPVSMLDRFDPPKNYSTMAEEERSELITGMAAAVLGLVGIEADPLRSRESILVTNILDHSWRRGQGIDLPGLIGAVAEPPFDKLGVFDLEQFFPKRARNQLAMSLNGLVASPSFAHWLKGVPLDIDTLMEKSPSGSRTSIFYVAHLDDGERMSFITLLLDRIIAWMRDQPGTGDLRALLYFDEVFGYLPPYPKNPSSKRPLLTLLKQARAYGVGTLLATQNPVDVDYKAITNAGTWLIGKLQTEQDKERILDGLMSASDGAGKNRSRREVSNLISGLQARQFLLSNAHVDEMPVLKSRFVMSYLRGPLTRQEIKRLKTLDFYNHPDAKELTLREAATSHTTGPTASAQPAPDAAPTARPGAPPVKAPPTAAAPSGPRPRPPGRSKPRRDPWETLPSTFLTRRGLREPEVRDALGIGALPANGGPVRYRPALRARAKMVWRARGGAEVASGELVRIIAPLPDDEGWIEWAGDHDELDDRWLSDGPAPGAEADALPSWIDSRAKFDKVRTRFKQALTTSAVRQVPACVSLGDYGRPGESLQDYRVRLGAKLRLAQHNALDKLTGRRGVEAGVWERRVAELREALVMDKRELAYLAEHGEPERLAQARANATHRMGQYKELLQQQKASLAMTDREITDTEFSAIDRLESVEMVAVELDAERTEVEAFDLLWIPSH